MSENKKEKNPIENTFHLAITMAGAVSAGAYTAGVIDYLLEVLDEWEKLKASGKYKTKLPTHNIKIEILSGASAGGMTACISSIVLHQKEKNHIDSQADEIDRQKNRLYNTWVNLNNGEKSLDGNDAIFELLSDYDVKRIDNLKSDLELDTNNLVPFPVSFFNSSIIRDIAKGATNLTDEEKDNLNTYGLPDYVASDFDVFVTLTSLKGFPNTLNLKKNEKDNYNASFTITDHRDVMMFNFGQDNKKDGIINIDLPAETENSEGIKLLRDAAVSTGAFPVGLEYGFVKRRTEYINKNFLMRHIHQHDKKKDIVRGDTYASAMIDGGLINNEPFELTEVLLEKRLKEQYPNSDEKVLKQKYSMLLIDPFPSKSIDFSVDNETDFGDVQNFNQQYPFSFKGAIGQLVSVARSQLLVKNLFKKESSSQETTFLEAALDEDEMNTFLISPRRYFSVDNKIAEGDKAIACGTLYGFGGFFDKRFREHDFFLGRANCQSFLQKHFKFKATELDNEKSPFYKSYSGEAKEFFLIKNTNTVETEEEWLPIIPNVNLLINNITDKSAYIAQSYKENEFPKMTETEFNTLFNKLEPKISKRIGLIKKSLLDDKWDFITDVVLFLNDALDWVTGRNILFSKIKPYIIKNLEEWKIIR